MVTAGTAPVSALAWALGGQTVIVGDALGHVSGWFRARPNAESDLTLVEAHQFAPQGSAIVAIGPSTASAAS